MAATVKASVGTRRPGSVGPCAARRRTWRRCRAGAATTGHTDRDPDHRPGRIVRGCPARSPADGPRAHRGATSTAARRTPHRRSRPGAVNGSRRAPPARSGQPDRRASSSRCSFASGATSRGCAATAPPGAGAARRDQCTVRRRAPVESVGGRGGSRPSARSTSTAARRCSPAPVPRGGDWSSTAVTLAPCWAAIAASSAKILPPGPAHRSNHRPASSPVTGASVNARATSWLPLTCTSALPSRRASSRPGSRR